MKVRTGLLATAFLGLVCVNADENSNYFESSTITEYAHFEFGTVGENGFMALRNPVLDEDTNQWGSDKDEFSITSSTDLVSPSEFKQVENNLYYVYHAKYVMPGGNNPYEYLYFDFLPLGSTLDDPQDSVVSRDFFSVWIKSSVAQRLRVEFHFETAPKKKSNPVFIQESSTFINYKIPVTNVGASVKKVSLSIDSAVSDEQTIDFALLAFSDSPNVITTLPSALDQNSSFEVVPAPSNCLAHYPEFLNEITPYALYRVTDQVPNEVDHNLGVLEADQYGDIISQTLEWRTAGQLIAGNFAVRTEFSLQKSSYIYFHNFYGSKKLLDQAPTPVDASDFGTHVCMWIRFPANHFIDLTLFTNNTHQSRKQIYVTTSDWINECVEVSSMSPKRYHGVDMSSLSQIFIGFTNQDTASNFVLEYTMIYFTNAPKRYTTMPAAFNPGFILRDAAGAGGCEYVTGPDQGRTPPANVPPKTPLAAYQRPYDGEYPANNRLAVYVIDENSHWLALVHALKIMGIPLVVTTNLQYALRHRTVVVYPEANDSRLNGQKANQLADHALANTVVFTRLNTAGLPDTLRNACGVEQTVESQREYSYIKFERGNIDSPAALFGCDVGPKWTEYACPAGKEDTELYIKIWEDWEGPIYNYGLGRPAQRIQVKGSASAIATYTRRTPLRDANGEVVYDGNDFVTYEDKDTPDVAVSHNSAGDGGTCYVVGVDLGKLCSDSRNYDLGGMSRTYSSAYEPGLDMLIRMVKNIYTSSQDAVTLHPIPHGKQLAVMYTHDVDANEPDIWKMFAQKEKDAGIKSTFMLYTKITRDDYDVPFYLENEETFLELIALGHELASHSVSHSPNFFDWNPNYIDFPLGTGQEEYAYGTGYGPEIVCTDVSHLTVQHPVSKDTVSICDHPGFARSVLKCNYWRRMFGSDDNFVCGMYRTVGNGTVLGELQVSKFLIDSVYKKAGMPDKQARAFRSGHLRYPATLNEALEATGYSVSSINQANELNTHLYFRMLYGHDGAGRNPGSASGVDVFEMPIQFEDTVSWPLRATYSDVQGTFDMATYTHETAARIAKFGGIVMVLTHPTNEAESRDNLTYTGLHKVEWEIEFTNNVKDYASFLTITEMGDFVAARDVAEVDFKQNLGGEYVIRIELPTEINGLAIEVPSAWVCSGNSILSQSEDNIDVSRSLVVLEELDAGIHTISCV